MSVNDPALQVLIDRVLSAQAAGAQLDIRGGGTKAFYGEAPVGEPLDTRVLEGISSYEPTELVVTARWNPTLAGEGKSRWALLQYQNSRRDAGAKSSQALRGQYFRIR